MTGSSDKGMTGPSGQAAPGWRLVAGRSAELVRKELLQLFRDRVLIGFLVYVFTVDIFLAATGLSFSLRNAAIAVLDNDNSQASRDLASRFQPLQFRRAATPADERAGDRAMDRGAAMVLLEIPPRFEADLIAGRQVPVLYSVDATNSVLGLLAGSHGREIVAGVNGERLAGTGNLPLPLIENRQRALFNPNQNESWFMSIAELLNVVTVFAILLPAIAAVREKERGNIEQLLASPLSPIEIMLPKIVAMMLVILVGIALSLGLVLSAVLHVPIRGSAALFFGVSAIYIFATAGIGLFFSTIARNMAQVGMLSILVIAPMMFLSGMWTPPEALPEWMRWLMLASPMSWYIDAGFGVLLKGMGLIDIIRPLAVIIAMGCLCFGLGLWRFRRQFSG